jgi:hypothetical protein
MAIGGNADACAARAVTGIDQMIFMFQIGRTTHSQIVGEKVIPRFAG